MPVPRHSLCAIAPCDQVHGTSLGFFPPLPSCSTAAGPKGCCREQIPIHGTRYALLIFFYHGLYEFAFLCAWREQHTLLAQLLSLQTRQAGVHTTRTDGLPLTPVSLQPRTSPSPRRAVAGPCQLHIVWRGDAPADLQLPRLHSWPHVMDAQS